MVASNYDHMIGWIKQIFWATTTWQETGHREIQSKNILQRYYAKKRKLENSDILLNGCVQGYHWSSCVYNIMYNILSSVWIKKKNAYEYKVKKNIALRRTCLAPFYQQYQNWSIWVRPEHRSTLKYGATIARQDNGGEDAHTHDRRIRHPRRIDGISVARAILRLRSVTARETIRDDTRRERVENGNSKNQK